MINARMIFAETKVNNTVIQVRIEMIVEFHTCIFPRMQQIFSVVYLEFRKTPKVLIFMNVKL